MRALNVVLIGCSESVAPHVRRELLNRGDTVEAEFADARQASEGLRLSQTRARVFVLHLKSSLGPDQVSQLSGRFIGQPVLALLDAGTDSVAILAAMRAGAAQVVPLPLQADDFKAALDSISLQLASHLGEAMVLAVSGATGGCGTTTIAINLAHEIACAQKLSCILIDLSLKMGMAAAYLNVEPRHTTADLLREFDRLDLHMVRGVLTRVADNFDILAGPKTISLVEARTQDVRHIIDYARQLADVIILDVPCSFDRLYFETLAAAGQIVLIGEQRVPSVRALSLIRDVLARDTGTLSQSLVINRYDAKLTGFTSRDLKRVLKAPHLRTIANDAAVLAAVNNGRPVRLEAPGSLALADIAALARSLVGAEDQPHPHAHSRPSFLGVLRAIGVAS
jgi:pilus assembly protein CpaE